MTLPTDRRVILAMETDAAAGLLREALLLLAKHPGPDNADAFFACLAMGMEKLLKLSIGLDGLERRGGWPRLAVMSDQYRHRLATMDTELRQIIRDNASTNAGHVLATLDALDADPLIGRVIETMTRYARFGRFYNLDYLAEGPPKEASPRHLWSDLESEVSTPALIAETLATVDNPSAWRRAVVSKVDTSIRAWVECYRVAWVQGVFGPLGRQLSGSLRVV